MDAITSDKSLKVGDLVINRYHAGENVFRITKISRRFLTPNDILRRAYSDYKAGDEYNPLMTIEAIADLSIKSKKNEKLRKKVRELDASYLVKVDSQYLKDHIDSIQTIIDKWLP